MSFDSTTISAAEAQFENIKSIQKSVAAVMRGRVDATIHGAYFGHKLMPDEKIVLRDLALGYLFRSLRLAIDELTIMGVSVDVLFSWLPVTAEEFIAYLVAEHEQTEPQP